MHIKDLAILTAFTALGLGCFVSFPAYDTRAYVHIDGAIDRTWDAGEVVVTASRCLTSLLLAWSAAFGVFRARGPRPPLRDLWTNVGTSAAAAALVVVLCRVVELVASEASLYVNRLVLASGEPYAPDVKDSLRRLLLEVGGSAGAGVIAVWSVLALAGRLKARQGWLEALGGLLGCGWILLLFEPALAAIAYGFSWGVADRALIP
jgi:hypothetical protein